MRDVNSFRERFKRWKKGGKPYKNGQIIRDTDMMDERVEQTPVLSDIPYPMLTSRDYDDARAWKLGYFQDAGANGHLWTRDYKTGRYLKSATHPTTGMAVWEDMKEGYDVYQRNGLLYSQPNFSTQKEIERNKKNLINVPNLPGYDDGKDDDGEDGVRYYKHYEGLRGSEWYVNPDGSITTIDGRTGGSFYLPEVEVKPDWDAVARYKAQGEINPAETNPVKQAWNNYIGELKYNLNQGKLPTSPQYIYPAAALGAGAIMLIPNMLKMTPSAFLGRGAYNTVLGGTGRSLAGALGDAALGGYFGAEGILQFKDNPNVTTGAMAGLGLLPLTGPIAKGLQQIKNPWTNPESLLSRNIRTSFYNMKEPLRYNWYDPNNITPYIYGALNTAIGRTVRQNSVPKMFKTAPMILPDVVNNRMAAWAKYLGVDDNISLLKSSFFNDGVINIGPYTKRADGSFGVNLTQEEREPYVTNLIHNANKQLRDIVLGNHGGMGYSLKINDNAEFPATLEFSDVWDLLPFKEIKQFPSWLRNLEASLLLPAGAKPFTYRGSVAVSRKNMDRILESMKYPPEFEKIDYGTYNHIPDLFPTKSPNEGGGIFSNVMRFINSPLTGNWARFGSKEYRFKPGVLGMNGTPIESRPLITADNAAAMSDIQWDAVYNAAVKAGDMVEAQRLRDLHFIAKAPNTKIKQDVYHGTDSRVDFGNKIRLNKSNHGKAFYTATNKTDAETYAGYTKDGKPLEDNIIKFKVNSENPYVPYDYSPDVPTGYRNRLIKHGYDGVLQKGFGYKGNVFVGIHPNKLKLSDAITHDNAGNIIPLSKRDNFNINDLRYMLPYGIFGAGTLGTLGLSNHKHGKDALPGFGGGKPGMMGRVGRLATWGPTLGFVMNQEGGTRGKGAKHQITRDPGDGVEAVGYGVRDPYWVNLARKNGGLTESEARQAAIQSLENNRRTLSKYGWYNGLPTDARMVVDDIAYQIGTGTLLNKSPKFIAAVESGNWAEAARQMDWGNRQKSYDGKKMPGVVKRNLDRQRIWNKTFNLGAGDYVRGLEIPMMSPVDVSHYAPKQSQITPVQVPAYTEQTVVPEQYKAPRLGFWGGLSVSNKVKQQMALAMMNIITE